jgi:hypothetical protein
MHFSSSITALDLSPGKGLNDLDFDSAQRAAERAFCHQLSFHSRVKSANVTQNPMIAAQAFISMIEVNVGSSNPGQIDTPGVLGNPLRHLCCDVYR